jgi:hypothetical protein
MFGKAIILGLAIMTMALVSGCGGGSIGFIPDDNTNPDLTILGIADGDQYGNLVANDDMVDITAVAADDAGIAAMELRIDGALVASSNSGLLEYTWDAVAEGNGVHELAFKATDENGNSTTETIESEVVNMIIVNPDIDLPDLDFFP